MGITIVPHPLKKRFCYMNELTHARKPYARVPLLIRRAGLIEQTYLKQFRLANQKSLEHWS
jgi:hypothetical protein